MALASDNSNGEQAIISAVQAALAPVQAALAAVVQQQQAVPHSAQPASLARDPRCSNCGGMGHWRAVCPSPVKASNFRGNEQQQQQAGPPSVSQRFACRPQNPNATRGRGRGGPATQMQRPGAQFANPIGQANAYGRASAQPNPFIPPTHMGTNANATSSRRTPHCLTAMLTWPHCCAHTWLHTHTLTTQNLSSLTATGFVATTGGEQPLDNMEQYYNYQQADPNFDQCDYVNYGECNMEPKFYDQEEAMMAHIPGLQGRAATLGDQFSANIFDKNFGTSAEPTHLPNADDIHSTDETTDDAYETGFLSNDCSSGTCNNPFAGANPVSRRLRNTASRIWSTFIPVLYCFHALLALVPGQLISMPHTRSTIFTFTVIALILIGCFPSTANAMLGPPSLHGIALACNFGATTSALQSYLLDSGCSTSIICDTKYLHNIRPSIPVHVKGLIGVKTIVMRADLYLPVRTATHVNHTIIVEGRAVLP